MAETHACRWPTCPRQVPLKMWGCKTHWFRLPKAIRDRIWATYRPGQEETLDPSAGWIEADEMAREWARENDSPLGKKS